MWTNEHFLHHFIQQLPACYVGYHHSPYRWNLRIFGGKRHHERNFTRPQLSGPTTDVQCLFLFLVQIAGIGLLFILIMKNAKTVWTPIWSLVRNGPLSKRAGQARSLTLGDRHIEVHDCVKRAKIDRMARDLASPNHGPKIGHVYACVAVVSFQKFRAIIRRVAVVSIISEDRLHKSLGTALCISHSLVDNFELRSWTIQMNN